MKKFEYLIEVLGMSYMSRSEYQNYLNKRGEAGWELVEAKWGNRNNQFTFKREKLTDAMNNGIDEKIETETEIAKNQQQTTLGE